MNETINFQISKAVEQMEKAIIDGINKPIYEFVATYDAGRLTRYIGQ